MKKTGDNRRIQKVEAEIQRIVALYFSSHLRSEISGLLTVTRVWMPADFRAAKVFYSILNGIQKEKEILSIMDSHAPEIQRNISLKLRMRYCPKLSFQADDSLENVLKVESILKELSDEKKKTETIS